MQKQPATIIIRFENPSLEKLIDYWRERDAAQAKAYGARLKNLAERLAAVSGKLETAVDETQGD